MPEVGIEPTFLSEHDLKSCAYANSATRAIFEAWGGCAPPYIPFAEECLAVLATRPLCYHNYSLNKESILWRFFSPRSISKSIIGILPSFEFSFTNPLNSLRFRLANSSAVFSKFSGNTVKKIVAYFSSPVNTTLVTVIREDLFPWSNKKRAPRSRNISVIFSLLLLIAFV